MAVDAQRGARLAQERKRLDMTQQAAAEAVGIRREMWARYEAGAEPGADVTGRMAQAGVDLSYVLTGETQLERARRTAANAIPPAMQTDIDRLRRLQETIRAGPAQPASRVAVPLTDPSERKLLDSYRRCAPSDKKRALDFVARLAKP